MKNFNSRITPDILNELFPLNFLTENEKALLCNKSPRLYAKSGQQLIQLGSTDNRAVYLLRGSLKLVAKDGHSHVISADSEDAKRAISHLIPHWYNVTCASEVEFFWVDNYVLDNLLQHQGQGGQQVQNLDVDPRLYEHKLFQRIYHDLTEDKLALPTLPEILARIDTYTDQQSQSDALARMVSSDPAVSAVLLKIANCPVYRQGPVVDTVKQAVDLIGMEQTKDILHSNITQALRFSHSPAIIKRVQAVWWHSAEVGAISYALAKLLDGFDPKRALLMGLLHDIGMLPIYCYADRFPELVGSEMSVDELVKQIHGDLGAIILAAWGFPLDFVEMAIESDNWHHESSEQHDYSDLVMMAQLHSFIGKGEEKQLLAIPEQHLPKIVELPAYRKLGLHTLTPEHSVWLLNTAKHKLSDLRVRWGIADSWGTDHWCKVKTA